jgi:hypothetical protein
MPRGGARAGAGRPVGSRTRRVEWREEVAARLAGALAECPDGVLVSVIVEGVPLVPPTPVSEMLRHQSGLVKP